MVLTPPTPPTPHTDERRSARLRGPGALLEQLNDARPLVRRWGARDLSAFPNAPTILMAHLAREGERTVREVILANLGRIGGDEVIRGLLPMLASDDAHLRNDVAELLQGMATEALPHLDPWLGHPDAETRALALSILAAAPADASCAGMRQRLERERDPLLLAHAITHLGEAGPRADARFLETFPPVEMHPLARFAVNRAVARLTAPTPRLTPLTTASAEEIDLFQELLERATGMRLSDNPRLQAGRLLVQLALRQGKESVRALLRELTAISPWDSWRLLLDQLFPQEMALMHQPETLQGLTRSVLGEVLRLKPPGSPLSMWCHSPRAGREAFALAIHLIEHWSPLAKVQVHLVESGPSPHPMPIARQVIFPTHQLAGLDAAARTRHFTPEGPGLWRVAESIQQAVEFRSLNLNTCGDAKKFRGFDIILCRDLLFRLSPLERRQAAMVFFDALHPGGFLLLGARESLGRVTHLFQAHAFPDTLAYQKPVS